MTHNERVMKSNPHREVPLDALVVTRACKVCCGGVMPDEIMLVSPTGVVHQADGEVTDCGKDATRDGWWWRI